MAPRRPRAKPVSRRKLTQESVTRGHIAWLEKQAARLAEWLSGEDISIRSLAVLTCEQRHIQNQLVAAQRELVAMLEAQAPPERSLTAEERAERLRSMARNANLDELEIWVREWCERLRLEVWSENGTPQLRRM